MDGFSGQMPFLLLMLVVFFFLYHSTPTKKTEKGKEFYEKPSQGRSRDHQKWDSC